MLIRLIFVLLFSTLFTVSCSPVEPKEPIEIQSTQTLTHRFTASSVTMPSEYIIHPHIEPYINLEENQIMWVGTQTTRHPTPEGFENITSYYLITSGTDGNTVSVDAIFSDSSDSPILEGGIIDNGILTAGVCLYEGEKSSHYILQYDVNTKSKKYSPSIDALFTDYIYIDTLIASKDLICLYTYSEILVLDNNYNLLCSIKCPLPPDDLCVSPEGIFHILADFGKGQKLYPIDLDRKSLSTGISVHDQHIGQAFFSEDGILYYTIPDGLYTYSDGNSSQIMSFPNSGVDFFDINILKLISNEKLFVIERQYGGSSLYFSAFEKAPDIDPSQIRTIELAAVSVTYELTDSVNHFNRTNPDIRVNITDYSEYVTASNPLAGRDQLYFDITVNNYRPDIIYAHSSASVVEHILREEQYYDLYNFIDNDNSYTRTDFLGAYLCAYELNGHLWGITPYFSVDTLVGNASVLGNYTSWASEEMISFALSLQENITLTDEMTVHNLEEVILGDQGYGIFVNDEDFEEEAFANWLSLIKNLPLYSEEPQLSASDIEAKKYKEFLKRENGEVAVTPYSISSVSDWMGVYALFDTEDVVLIGYPYGDTSRATVNTGPSYIITSFTAYPEESWNVVKNCCMNFSAINLPILKADFKTEIDAHIDKTIISYFSGGSISSETNPFLPITADKLKKPGRVDLFTEKNATDFLNYIDNQSGTPLCEQLPENITAIFNEEIDAYLHGVRTAEECIRIVKSRVELWLNEKS